MNRGTTNGHVRNARLRLCQRLFVAAAESDPALYEDRGWGRTLSYITAILTRYEKKPVVPKVNLEQRNGTAQASEGDAEDTEAVPLPADIQQS